MDIEQARWANYDRKQALACCQEQHLHIVRQSNFYYAMQRGGIVASGPTSELSDQIVEEFLTV